jgi:hypothetical protein
MVFRVHLKRSVVSPSCPLEVLAQHARQNKHVLESGGCDRELSVKKGILAPNSIRDNNPIPTVQIKIILHCFGCRVIRIPYIYLNCWEYYYSQGAQF